MEADELEFKHAVRPALLARTAPISMWEALGMSEELYQQVGAHNAKIGHLEYELREMRRELSEIRQVLSEARGGWRTLMLVGGAAGAVGAGMAKLGMLLGVVK